MLAPPPLRALIPTEHLAKELRLPKFALLLARIFLLVVTSVMEDLKSAVKAALPGDGARQGGAGQGAERTGDLHPLRHTHHHGHGHGSHHAHHHGQRHH